MSELLAEVLSGSSAGLPPDSGAGAEEDHELVCLDGWVFTEQWLCDGNADCPDGSDEHYCGGPGEPPDITGLKHGTIKSSINSF